MKLLNYFKLLNLFIKHTIALKRNKTDYLPPLIIQLEHIRHKTNSLGSLKHTLSLPLKPDSNGWRSHLFQQRLIANRIGTILFVLSFPPGLHIFMPKHPRGVALWGRGGEPWTRKPQGISLTPI